MQRTRRVPQIDVRVPRHHQQPENQAQHDARWPMKHHRSHKRLQEMRWLMQSHQ
jgi:hypothetical protein